MKYVLTLFILFLFSFSAVAQTTISGGDITGTLTAADGPYTITGDVTVPADSLLTIEPGVSLFFNDTTKLFILGNIKAIGTASSRILFTKNGTDSLRGWAGIFINNDPQSDTNYFEHCEIKRTSPGGRYFLWMDPNDIIYGAAIRARSASPCVISYCSFGKQKYGISSIGTDMIIKNCDFKNSSPFTVDPEDYFTRDLEFNDGYLIIENCIFENNVYGLSVGDVHNDGDYNVKNCTFNNIRIRSAILFGKCNISQCTFLKSGMQAINLYLFSGIIDQCTFDSSYGISNSGKNISMYGATSSSIIQNCTFKNTEVNATGLGNFDITASNGSLPVIDNCIFDNALGIINDGTAYSSIMNSTIVNCPSGFDIYGSINILNCLFVNNKIKGIMRPDNDPFILAFSPALNVGVGTVNVYNSIFWNNYDNSNTKKNIHLYESGSVNLYNCVLDGGKSSITKYGDSNFVFAGTYQDCSSDYPGFVDSANGDYRSYQDCNQTPLVMNKGYGLPIRARHRELGESAKFYDDILAEITDADGNPRVWNDTVDIGPYELPLRKTIEASEHPKGLDLCENESGELNSAARGIGVSTMWQSSSSGGTYSDLGNTTDDLTLNAVQGGDSGLMYRVRWKNQCSDTLYSNPAILNVHLPTAISLGEDFRLSIDSSAKLSPGQGFSKYTWDNGTTAPIINIHGEQLGLGEHTFSVSVENQYGCTSTDSITVTVAIINGIRGYNWYGELVAYPNPGMGLVKVKGMDDFTYSIFNMTGQEIFSDNTKTGEVNTEQLESGSYLIVIQNGDEYFRLRWVKE
jgi:hypothetical protein